MASIVAIVQGEKDAEGIIGNTIGVCVDNTHLCVGPYRWAWEWYSGVVWRWLEYWSW